MESEFAFIEKIRKQVKGRNQNSLIGDDCAVIQPTAGHEILLTADLLIENIDFRPEWAAAEDIGYKSLAVSLSDIAAMGGVPRSALLSIGVPLKDWKSKFLDRFYQGWFELADKFGVELIGGDISKSPDKLVIDSIVIAEAKRGMRVLRTGAKPGDVIFVSGSLGGAAAALDFLKRSKTKLRKQTDKNISSLLKRQLRPNPRVELGKLIGAKHLATSMIDLSDGLSSDLAHICVESGVGAEIELDKIPVDKSIERLSAGSPRFEFSKKEIEFALDGGEDFELLFTASSENAKRIHKLFGDHVTEIGRLVDQWHGIRFIERGKRRKLKPGGFSHF